MAFEIFLLDVLLYLVLIFINQKCTNNMPDNPD